MIVHCYKGKVKHWGHDEEVDGEFDEFDWGYIKNKGEPDWMAYYYRVGSYDGDGYVLYRKDNKWYSYGFSHCSCYGPVDDGLPYDEGFITLDEMIEGGSEQFVEETKPLFELARKFCRF